MFRKQSKMRMCGNKIAVHPLFICLLLYYIAQGKALYFLLSVLAVLLHEAGHAYVAERRGFALEKLSLLPCGAVVSLDLEGVSQKDEILIALGGPIVNLVTAVFFFALWWFLPETYAYTDLAAYTSLTVGLCNLLPAYPLDGGRIFNATLRLFISEKTAKIASVTVAVGFFVCFFVLGAVYKNASAVFFASFILFGCVQKVKPAYKKINFSNPKALYRGVQIRYFAVGKNFTVKQAIRKMSEGYYTVFVVFDEKEACLGKITQNQTYELFTQKGLYAKLTEKLP